MSVQNIKNINEFDEFIKSDDLLIIHFYAPWADQCTQINELLEDLSKRSYKDVKFLKIEAEELSEISLKYQVTAVPEIIFVQNLNVIDRVTGVDTASLVDKLQKYSEKSDRPAVTKKLTGDQRLLKLINQAKCMLFMKGNPQAPKCGFSRTIIGLLDSYNVDYQSFDILQDNTVREGLKKFSNWPTYPQLYLDGELLGGLDIIAEMSKNGELEGILPKKS